MIKLTGEKDGKRFLAFGLSTANLKKLMEEKPILVDLKEMLPDLDIELFIFWGPNEQAMYDNLKPMLRDVPIHEFKEKQ